MSRPFYKIVKTMKVHPEDVLFTQDSISSHFNDGTPISDYIGEFYNKKIIVTEYEGELYTLNNRSLYVLRYQNLNSIDVNVVNFKDCQKEFYEKFTTKCNGKYTRVRGQYDNFEVRPSTLSVVLILLFSIFYGYFGIILYNNGMR